MTLHCAKTGRWWPCCDEAHGHSLARRHGLKEYTICPDGLAVPTIKETWPK